MLGLPESKEATMQLAEFLEYLRVRSTTSELAVSLAEVLVRRGRLDHSPVKVNGSAPRRITS